MMLNDASGFSRCSWMTGCSYHYSHYEGESRREIRHQTLLTAIPLYFAGNDARLSLAIGCRDCSYVIKVQSIRDLIITVGASLS